MMTTFSIIIFSTNSSYAECHLCSVLFMLSAAYKYFILSVIMLKAVMLSVIMADIPPSKQGNQLFRELLL